MKLIELLAAAAIVILLAGLALNGFGNDRDAQTLRADAENLVSLLGRARSETLASRAASQYGVHLASSSAALFSGSVFAPQAVDATTTFSSQNVASWNLAGGVSDIVFQRLTGKTDQSGTITLQIRARPSAQATATIEATGFVWTQ